MNYYRSWFTLNVSICNPRLPSVSTGYSWSEIAFVRRLPGVYDEVSESRDRPRFEPCNRRRVPVALPRLLPLTSVTGAAPANCSLNVALECFVLEFTP